MGILLDACVGDILEDGAARSVFGAIVDVPRILVGRAVPIVDPDLPFRLIDPLEDVHAPAGAAERHDVPLAVQPRHVHAVRVEQFRVRRLLDVPDAIVPRLDGDRRRDRGERPPPPRGGGARPIGRRRRKSHPRDYVSVRSTGGPCALGGLRPGGADVRFAGVRQGAARAGAPDAGAAALRVRGGEAERAEPVVVVDGPEGGTAAARDRLRTTAAGGILPRRR